MLAKASANHNEKAEGRQSHWLCCILLHLYIIVHMESVLCMKATVHGQELDSTYPEIGRMPLWKTVGTA